MTTTIRLFELADVLTVLPYQLGFHPRRCLVAVSLHGTRGARVGLVQRIDLPPPEHVDDAVAAMITPLQQEGPKSVLLIGFEEDDGESRPMLDQMASACRVRGLEVVERMVVRGGRWFNPDCGNQICCPPEGLSLPTPSAVPAVAEFVGREISPLPDRAALVALLEPDSPQLSEAVSRLANEWLQLRQEAIDAGQSGPSTRRGSIGQRTIWQGSTRQGSVRKASTRQGRRSTEESDLDGFRVSELALWSVVLCGQDDAQPIRALSPQDLAMLAGSLTDVDLRDGLIARLCPGTLPCELIDPTLFAQLGTALPDLPWLGQCGGDEHCDDQHCGDEQGGDTAHVIGQQRIERRLCELSAALPDVWAVAALTVLASFTWWRGNGALTRVALDRALRVDPDYRLARLLERMVDLGIRPVLASPRTQLGSGGR